MQVSIETTSALERRMTIGVPAEIVESEINARLKKASGNVRIDGFRPGKVPMKVVKQRYGAGVRQEVQSEMMSQHFYKALMQENLKPAGQPSIEPKTMEEGKDFEFIATFEIFPDVELKSLDLTIEKLIAEVTDADVSKMIDILRKQQATHDVVEREAVEGDTVIIDFVGTKDGEEFEGGSATASSLVLGSKQMIPGFEDGIAGMKAGEEKVLTLTFPDDYHAEALKGAAVEFKVTVNEVKEEVLAELNEDLFVKYGVKEGGEEKFREEIAANMARELKQNGKNKIKEQVMEGLLAAHPDLQLPSALLKQETEVLRGQMVQQFGAAAGNMDMQSLLPDEMFKDQAERRVKLGLLMNELISKKELKADADKVKETIEEMASTYEDSQEVVDYYYQNKEQLQKIEAMVLEDTVVDSLLEDATVTEKAVSYDEVMAPAQSAEEDGE